MCERGVSGSKERNGGKNREDGGCKQDHGSHPDYKLRQRGQDERNQQHGSIQQTVTSDCRERAKNEGERDRDKSNAEQQRKGVRQTTTDHLSNWLPCSKRSAEVPGEHAA